MTDIGLPWPSVAGLIEKSPIEDMALFALRDALPEVPIFSLVPENPPADGFVLVRKDDPIGSDHVLDQKFVSFGHIFVNTFTRDPDGDEKGALLSEAVRVALKKAWQDQLYVPDRGWIIRCRTTSTATRVTDWATSSGPVQYADLPTGYWRYESKFSLKFRVDNHHSFL